MKNKTFWVGLVILTLASSAKAAFLGPEILISPAPNWQSSPNVVYDPVQQRFFVAWEDYRSGPTRYDIYGRFLSLTGTLVGNAFSISTAPNDQFYPSVSFDPTSQRFLVGWMDYPNAASPKHNYYQLFDTNGTLLGTEFSIPTTSSSQGSPSVVYDPATRCFLVIWGEDRSGTFDIFGQLISTTGTLVGSDFSISTAPNYQGSPTAAYDSVNQRFLVAWEDRRSGSWSESDVYGQLINADGSLFGTEISISIAPDEQSNPFVAFDPVNQRFLVVWEDYRGPAYDIYGQLISSAGALVGGNFSISVFAPSHEFNPSAAFDPVNQRLFVTWEDFRGPEYDIYGQFISADGTLIGTEISFCAARGYQDNPFAAYDPVNQRFIVVWGDFRHWREVDANPDIYGRLFSFGGIETAKLPDGLSYVPYTAVLQATGGTQPYTWAVSSGTLPPGLTLTPSTGEFSGTPHTPGKYSFAAQVAEANGFSDTAVFTVTIGPGHPPTQKPGCGCTMALDSSQGFDSILVLATLNVLFVLLRRKGRIGYYRG